MIKQKCSLKRRKKKGQGKKEKLFIDVLQLLKILLEYYQLERSRNFNYLMKIKKPFPSFKKRIIVMGEKV